MADLKQLFMSYFDQIGFHYTDHDRFVETIYSAKNMSKVTIRCYFDKNTVQFVCSEIEHFGEDKLGPAMVACNQMNAQYAWTKFNVDSDGDVICRIDAIIDEDSVGQECRSLLGMMSDIIDEAYPTFAKLRWA